MRDESPRTNRSVSSSGDTFSSLADILRMEILTYPSGSRATRMYALVPGSPYFAMLTKRFSNIRYVFWLSRYRTTRSSGRLNLNSIPLASILSDSSKRTCFKRLIISTFSGCRVTVPLLALLTSNRSSISTFRRMDFWSNTWI